MKTLFSDGWWDDARRDFNTHANDIRHVYHESKAETLHGSSPDDAGDFDSATGLLKLGIAFSKSRDDDFLDYAIRESRRHIPKLEKCFLTKDGSSDFIFSLNRFYYAYGYIFATINNHDDGLGPTRAGQIRGSKASNLAREQKRWVSHLLQKELQSGRTRKEADFEISKTIAAIIKATEAKGDDATWFKDLLVNKCTELRSTFTQKNLTRRQIDSFVAEGCGDIPSLDIPS